MGCVAYHQWSWATILFACAVATDFLDGFVARRYHQESRLGQLLDPIADKILIISLMYALFMVKPTIPLGLFFITKEIVLLGGAAILYARYQKFFKPTFLSRFVSVSEMVIIFNTLIGRALFGHQITYFDLIFHFCTGLLLIASLILSVVLLARYVVEVVIFIRKK